MPLPVLFHEMRWLLWLLEGDTAVPAAVVIVVDSDLSNIIRRMEIVDGALDNSDGIFFTFM